MAKTGSRDRGLFEREKGSGVWWIQYSDHLGKKRRELAGAKARARELYQERKREVRLRRQSPRLAAEMGPAVTFAEVAKDCMAYCESRHASVKTDEGRMNRMRDWWGAMPAAELTAGEIESRFDTLRDARTKEPLAGATFNRFRALLSLAFRLAQRNGKIPAGFNPARLVEMRKESGRVRWLTADEEQRLRGVIEREYPDKPWIHVLNLALNIGLRWSDQAGLTAENREGNSLRLLIGKTRTLVGMKLNGIAAEAFDALCEISAESEVSNRSAEVSDRSGISNLKSEIPSRGFCGSKTPRHWFNRSCRLAEIKDFHWHDLRHTFATRLLQAGVPAEQVQRLMGHKSITMTLRYAHVVEGFETDALTKLAKINEHCAKGGAAVVSIASKRKAAKRAASA